MGEFFAFDDYGEQSLLYRERSPPDPVNRPINIEVEFFWYDAAL